MKLTIIGTGFVGVVSSAVYASFDNQVVGLDIDSAKIESLRKGKVPFFEPGLEKLLIDQQKTDRLSFTTSYEEAIPKSEVILIAVGTPSAEDGQADLKYVFAVAESIAPHLDDDAIIIIKSTVPPGTLDRVASIISKITKKKFHMASMPEFLREGSAVHDTLNPDRIVIGATDDFTFDKLEKLHQAFKAPIIKVRPESAQMGKYTANAYLALRITFINQIADLCEKNGADIKEVIEVIGYDKRIGKHYWYPGFGYGGSCFPKDVKELAAYSRSVGEDNNLLNKMDELNSDRITHLMDGYEEEIGSFKGKKVAILGLSFKPHTNDMREAPSIKAISYLTQHGATIVGYDPEAVPDVDFFIPQHPQASYTENISKAVKDADIIMALIEWPEILEFDFVSHKSKKDQWFIDARNQHNPDKLAAAGYKYIGVGTGPKQKK